MTFMLRAWLGCFVALLCICGGAVADSTGAPFPPVVLAHDGVRIRVWETLNKDDEFKTLHVKATRDGRTVAWRYGDSGLDPEETGAAPAETLASIECSCGATGASPTRRESPPGSPGACPLGALYQE